MSGSGPDRWSHALSLATFVAMAAWLTAASSVFAGSSPASSCAAYGSAARRCIDAPIIRQGSLPVRVDVALPLCDVGSQLCLDRIGGAHFSRVNHPANCLGPINVVDGRVPMATRLDGSTQYLMMADDADSAVAGQGEASFDRAIRFRINSHPAPSAGSALLWATDDGAETGFYVILMRSSDDTYSYILVKMSGVKVFMDSTANRITDHDWHHVRVAYDGQADRFTVVVDNNSCHQVVSSEVTAVASTQQVYIGRKSTPQYHLDGSVADLYCLNGACWSDDEATMLAGTGISSTFPFQTYSESLDSNLSYLSKEIADAAAPSMWRLDEACGPRVDCVGANDLTPQGGLTCAPGLLEGTVCASFDGYDDYLERSSEDCQGIDEMLLDDWTLSFWVYFDALPSANNHNVILVDKINPDDQTGWEVFALGNDVPDHFGAKVRNGSDFFVRTLGSYATNDIITGCWYHCLFEYDYSLRLFTIAVNDEVSLSGTVDPPGIVPSTMPLRAGCAHYQGKFLEGRMQQLALFTCLLTDQQKADLFNHGFGIPLTACPADVNDDGAVNIDDLFQLLGTWGPCWECVEDITGDGQVDIEDIFDVLADWGLCL